MRPNNAIQYDDLWRDLGKEKIEVFEHFTEKAYSEDDIYRVISARDDVLNGLTRQFRINFPYIKNKLILTENVYELVMINLINCIIEAHYNQGVQFFIKKHQMNYTLDFKKIKDHRFVVFEDNKRIYISDENIEDEYKSYKKVYINRYEQGQNCVLFNLLSGDFTYKQRNYKIIKEMEIREYYNVSKMYTKSSILSKFYFNDRDLLQYFADMSVKKYKRQQPQDYMILVSKNITTHHLFILHKGPSDPLEYVDDSAFFNYIFRYRYVNSFSKDKKLDLDRLGCYLSKQSLRNVRILESISVSEIGVQLIDSYDNEGVFAIMNKNSDTVHGYCWTPSVEKEADVELDLLHCYHLCSPIFREKKMMLQDTAYKWLMIWWCLDAVKNSPLSSNIRNIFVVTKSTVKAYDIMPGHYPHYTEVRDILNDSYYLSSNQYPEFIEKFKKKLVEEMDKFLNKKSYVCHSFGEIIHQLENLVEYKSQYSRYYPSPVTNKHTLLYAYNQILNQYRGEYILDGKEYRNSYDKLSGVKTTHNLISAWLTMNTTIAEVPCCCKDKILHKLLPTPSCYNKSAMIYNNCLRTTFAAFKRQCKLVPKPDKKVLDEYIDFVKKFFEVYIEPLLKDFDYSYNQWFNKNTKPKQDDLTAPEISRLIELCQRDTVLEVAHDLFCKIEKQEPGGKNRAISAIIQIVKYIMGPVTWRLEESLGKSKFYCGKKNADDYSEIYTKMMKRNKKVIEGDGSGFDQTQHMELKYIDRLIYNAVKDKVWHVNKETFINTCVTPIKTLRGDFYLQKKKRSFIHGQLYGTVFSGSSDTTLMNTVRMTTYNVFTLYKAGLFNFEPDYQGLHKGDDFVEFANYDENEENITQTYNKYWASKQEKKYSKGIGQILKIIEILPIEKSSFCSCIVLKVGDELKYVRDPKRMVRFAPFARKTAYYKEGMIHQYLEDQAVALEESGLKNVPFYKTFIKVYREQKKKYAPSSNVLVVGTPKVTRTPDQPELLCKARAYTRNLEVQKVVMNHPILGKIETTRLKGKKYIYSDEVHEVTAQPHKWFDDKTIKYDEYLANKDYYYSRIKNDRKDQIEIDEISFYEQLNSRYTNEKCNWSMSEVKRYEKFLLDPESSKRFEQYKLLDKDSYNEDIV